MGVMKSLSDIRQVISELEGWEKEYLPDNPQAGKIKLLDIVGDRPLKSVVSWSEWNNHKPEADKVKAEYTKIVQWVRKGNSVLSQDLDGNPFVADEKGFRLQLTDLLRSIEGNIRTDFAIERPTETKQKEIFEAKPGVAGFTVNIKEIAKRIWKYVCSRSKD